MPWFAYELTCCFTTHPTFAESSLGTSQSETPSDTAGFRTCSPTAIPAPWTFTLTFFLASAAT